MQDKFCMHSVVSGRVQGVYFRASTLKQAESLHLTGWVRNLPDGRVEVLACGVKANVLALEAWLKVGPTAASVESVESLERPYEEHARFAITD